MEYANGLKPGTGSKAAAYLRLSQEDADKQESNSIKGQRQLIRDYVKNHPGLRLVREYADDGYSGTSFDRPDFQRMMEDAQRGAIDCVIVKDLSRLGRNYIGTGKYTERIFPSLGIRFISINDNYDSANSDFASESLVLPFKNLMNDAYSRDISTKIKSQLEVKKRHGDFIGNYAPYGYQKDEKNHNRLVVDDYAAGIVKKIFSWRLDGASNMEIAEKLNSVGTLSPMEYKRLKGISYNSGFRGKETPLWSAVQVGRILTNEVYIGNLVQGKYRKVNYKVKKIRKVPEEEQVRVEDTHEAVIDADTFLRVKELMALDTRAAVKEKGSNIFSGMVRCADCEQNMIRRVGGAGEKKLYYLHCSTHKNKMGCSSHMVNEQKLAEAVAESIRAQAVRLSALEIILQEMKKTPAGAGKRIAAAEHIKTLEAEIERYRMLRMQLYEDKAAGIISEEDYQQFSGSFTKKLEAALEAKSRIEEEIRSFTEADTDEMPFINLFKKYADAGEMDRRMVIELIDYIEVKDKAHFIIHFRYEDRMAALEKFCESYEGNGNTGSDGGKGNERSEEGEWA